MIPIFRSLASAELFLLRPRLLSSYFPDFEHGTERGNVSLFYFHILRAISIFPFEQISKIVEHILVFENAG